MTNKTPKFELNDACNSFEAHIRQIQPDYKITPENEKVIKVLVKYFNGIDGTNYSLKKGIYLAGPVGTGKTLLMKAFATWPGNPSKFKMVNTRDIQKEAAQHGYKALTLYSKQSYNYKGGFYRRENGAITYCFDDFGAEETSKFYGNDINVMKELLQDRYMEFDDAGMMTHITSNIKDGELIEKKYGERVRDRIRQMFNVVELLGKSHRQ